MNKINENRRSLTPTLTEEQYKVLNWLKQARYILEDESERYWETYSYGHLEPFANQLEEARVLSELKRVGLPVINYNSDFSDLPTIDDYYTALTKEERNNWEKRAEEYNKAHNIYSEEHALSGHDLWENESGKYEEFTKRMKELEEKVDEYFKKIDKQYGTTFSNK